MCFISEFTCRIVTYAEELVSIYICYSTGECLILPCLSLLPPRLVSVCDGRESCTVPSNPLY